MFRLSEMSSYISDVCSIANEDKLLVQLRTMRKSRIHDRVDAIDLIEATHNESLSFFERTVF